MNMLIRNRLHHLPGLEFSNKDFNSLFNKSDNAPRSNISLSNSKNFKPNFEVIENEANYEINAELPGIELQNIKISLKNSILTIKGEKKTIEERNYYISERKYGSFKRKFELPENADEENIKAELKNGILSLYILKNKKVEPKLKEIMINQG